MIAAPIPSTDLVDSFRKMREGLLYGIIGSILVGASVFIIIFGFLAAAFSSVSHGMGGEGAGPAIAIFASGVIAAIIGALLWLYGFYGKFIPGVEQLRKARPEYSTAASLIRIGFIWGLILIIAGVILTIILIGIFLVVIGYILLILGYIGIIILCFNLNSNEGNSLYLVAGILFIIGIIIPLLQFIAYILLYVALGDTLRRYSSMQPAPPVSLQPSPNLPPPI
jgi:MFS family permease